MLRLPLITRSGIRTGKRHITRIAPAGNIVFRRLELLLGKRLIGSGDMGIHAARQGGALRAAELGLVDDVIEPALTRPVIASALELLWSKRENRLPKKHGNMPL